jgi:hypothetical protein
MFQAQAVEVAGELRAPARVSLKQHLLDSAGAQLFDETPLPILAEPASRQFDHDVIGCKPGLIATANGARLDLI